MQSGINRVTLRVANYFHCTRSIDLREPEQNLFASRISEYSYFLALTKSKQNPQCHKSSPQKLALVSKGYVFMCWLFGSPSQGPQKQVFATS